MRMSETLQYLEIRACVHVKTSTLIDDAKNAKKNCIGNNVILKLCVETPHSETVEILPYLYLLAKSVKAKYDYSDLLLW